VLQALTMMMSGRTGGLRRCSGWALIGIALAVFSGGTHAGLRPSASAFAACLFVLCLSR